MRCQRSAGWAEGRPQRTEGVSEGEPPRRRVHSGRLPGSRPRLESGSEGGTGFQPVICDSHSRDGCANLRTEGIATWVPARRRGVLSWERRPHPTCPAEPGEQRRRQAGRLPPLGLHGRHAPLPTHPNRRRPGGGIVPNHADVGALRSRPEGRRVLSSRTRARCARSICRSPRSAGFFRFPG